jgi:hypothetical protein
MIVQKYDYKPIKRETVNGARHYATPDGAKLPSVTTILSGTASFEKMKVLAEWRNRIGKGNAQQITTEAANTGTAMHKKLEQYCLGTLKEPGSNIIQQQSYKMAEQIIEKGLVNVNEAWGLEVSLYYEGIYAGSTDLVGQWKGKDAIIDFKQTNKPKTKEMIEDYFLQLAAYSECHNLMFGTKMETGVVLMCSRSFDYYEFVIEGEEFKMYVDKWWNRVEKYYEKLMEAYQAPE